MSHNLPNVRVSALGYYGFGNLGDEAVLAGIRQALATTLNPDMLVLSANPAQTEKLHPGVRATARWSVKEAGQALRGTDLFILGGGSLLQDATSVKSVVWYSLMAHIARKRSRRVLWWGQGIGPLSHPLSRFLVKQIARQADAITVRDESSQKLLKQIGCGGVITVVADPAFALEPAPPVGVALPNDALLLSLRNWKTDDLSRVLKPTEQDSSANLQTIWQGTPIALPMHLPEDATYMKEVLGEWTAQYDWQASGATVEQTLGRFRGADLVVAMRLHALIFAARCTVPFVALSYDPKVNALAEAAGQADALIGVENITVAALQEKVQRVRETKQERQTHLQNFGETQRKRASIPAQIAGEWFS